MVSHSCEEVQALVNENAKEGDVIIYTDGSVIRHVRSVRAFKVQCEDKTIRKESGAFAVITSSMAMEIMAVTSAFEWVGIQKATQVCILSDSEYD